VSGCDIAGGPPNVDEEIQLVARLTREAALNNNDEDEDGGRRRGRRGGRENPVDDEYKNRPGWFSILSFSTGVSNESGAPRAHDWSIMKIVDLLTPALHVACYKGEIFPHAVLRYFLEAVDGKISILDYLLYNVMITSQQMSGSSERPVESITFVTQSWSLREFNFAIDTGLIEKDVSSHVRGPKQAVRQGVHAVAPLKNMCKAKIMARPQLYPRLSLARLPQSLLEELQMIDLAAPLPLQGRALLATADEPSLSDGGKRPRFQRFFLKTLTVAGLKAAVAEKFKRPLASVKAVCTMQGSTQSRLVEIVDDDEVWELQEDELIKVDFLLA